MDEAIEAKALHVTRKELFYAAMMLGIRQLVNVVYDFPANERLLNNELDDVKKELRKKKLLVESARGGVSLNFALAMCVAFCSEPKKCEVVETEKYYAVIYQAADSFMILENQQSADDLKALWFSKRENLNLYINNKIDEIEKLKKDGDDNGRS
ncbi:MAG: hypothetical protein IJ667_08160 [Synergistaceae bacterium]|nr:hypothetical protein [Synergistaceae bacterium]